MTIFFQQIYLGATAYGHRSSPQQSYYNRATATTSMSSFDSPEYYQVDYPDEPESRTSISYEPSSSYRSYSDQHSQNVQHIQYKSRGTNTLKF